MRFALFAALAAVLVAAGCGGSSGSDSTTATSAASSTTGTGAAAGSEFDAPLQIQTQAAPAIDLKDVYGKPFDLKRLKGKGVAVTFVYAHCPDVCPIMLGALQATHKRLGADAKRFVNVAVSVDPKGDTPAYVKTYLKDRHLGSIHYLVGTRKQLVPIWKAWNVASHGDPTDPAAIAHSSLIYLLDTRGRLRLLYPAQPLDSKGLLHDARLLARGA
jgi:protein SCO1/2